MKLFRYLLVLSILVSVVSCEKRPVAGNYPGGGGDVSSVPDDVPESNTLNITPIGKLNAGEDISGSHSGSLARSSLMLDFRSYRLLGEDVTGVTKSIYPRMVITPSGECQLFYHKEEGTSIAGNRTYRIVSDDMYSWKYAGLYNEIYDIIDSHGNPNKQGFADCFPLLLQNGEVISVTSTRAVRTVGGYTYRDNKADAGLIIKRSSDGGANWSAEYDKIYTGNNWEPFLLQKKNGDIHCYFTDSNQNIYDVWDGVYNNSGTALIVSKDNGNTWSESVRISGKLRDQCDQYYLFTNQMPSVIELPSGELVGAFEADKAKGGQNTDYYISFAYSGTDGEWDKISDISGGPDDCLDYLFPGCAPYLLHFPSGENVVSYNYSSKFCMRMSEDPEGRKWGNEMVAFPESGYYWGSMIAVDSHILFAAVGGNVKGMQIGKFVLNHDILATSRTVVTDGDNSEWESTDDALFVGSKSQAQVTLRCSSSSDNIFFLFEILDGNISINDYVTIMAVSPEQNSLAGSALRISASVGGLRAVEKYEANKWTVIPDAGVVVKTAIDGTTSTAKDKDHGYLIEMSVPRSFLPICDGLMKINLSLFDMSAGEDLLVPYATDNVDLWPLVGNLE